MAYFNSALTTFFDFLLAPFLQFHPLWPLFILSFVTGILLLVIFRYTSDQKAILKTKNRIKAHLLEARLFKDDLGILLSAQERILVYNAKYFMLGIKPMLVMIVPVGFLLIQLDGWFGFRPLMPGEWVLISVQLKDQGAEALSTVALDANEGLSIETPPLRIAASREVAWRIRALEPGVHYLVVRAGNHKIEKKISVLPTGLARVSPSTVAGSFWNALLHPGERPIPDGTPVERINANYPQRSIEVFGWKLHWMVLFFVLATLTGFAFKGFFRVEI